MEESKTQNSEESEYIGDIRSINKPNYNCGFREPNDSPSSNISNEDAPQEDTIEKAVRYLEKLKIGYDVKHAEDIKDSYTQTSKTILQLATIEKEGHISPDSLSSSPIPAERSKKKSHYTQNCSIETASNDFDPSMPYSRKNDIINYVNHYQVDKEGDDGNSAFFPSGSLIETYLSSKTNSRRSHISDYDKYSLNSEGISKSTHSRFLEQTSPFKNLVKNSMPQKTTSLKSQSYVEAPTSFKSQSYLEPPFQEVIRKVPPPVSRFTVKRVRQQNLDGKQQSNKTITSSENSKLNNDQSRSSALSPKGPKFSPKALYQSRRSNSFMSPTIASEQKSHRSEVNTIKRLISPTIRGRSVSPKSNGFGHSFQKIPYIDQNMSEEKNSSSSFAKAEDLKKSKHLINPVTEAPATIDFKENLIKLELERKYSEDSIYECSQVLETISSSSTDNVFGSILHRIRNSDWNVALRGLAEVTELCKSVDKDILYPHMVVVNQRLLELLRSPRSHVCRTACQAAGHLFESMKDTRRPEFDDIVDILLSKTADANKFIRQDANLALDCMVTHIPLYHSVRTLCVKGPIHKNHLVRTATVRLIICAVVIAGPANILNPTSNEITRKKIIINMTKFVGDKNADTRRYGERLYRILSKEPYFDIFLKKYLEKEEYVDFKKSLKFILKKH